MNAPLEHKGYTLYQASYAELGSGEATVLAVVQNYGRLFPYISKYYYVHGFFFTGRY